MSGDLFVFYSSHSDMVNQIGKFFLTIYTSWEYQFSGKGGGGLSLKITVVVCCYFRIS